MYWIRGHVRVSQSGLHLAALHFLLRLFLCPEFFLAAPRSEIRNLLHLQDPGCFDRAC
jgi:hypothetical protein